MPLASRRTFLTAGALGTLGAAAARWLGPLPSVARAGEPAALPSSFPTQDPELVREVVTVAHFDLEKLKALVEPRPTLARAAWDWGFGDWETALGAASHMGRRDIAEFLLAQGARPNLFSAAMLGQLEVVRAFAAAAPGVQRTPGPHGITLLAHARAGGEPAAAVLKYLQDLGDADEKPAVADTPADERARLTGFYAFGPEVADRLEVYEKKDGLLLRRADRPGRNLLALGSREFFPVGAPQVRIRFAGPADAPAAALSVWDPDLVVEAKRV